MATEEKAGLGVVPFSNSVCIRFGEQLRELTITGPSGMGTHTRFEGPTVHCRERPARGKV